jgi:hypothetical protein
MKKDKGMLHGFDKDGKSITILSDGTIIKDTSIKSMVGTSKHRFSKRKLIALAIMLPLLIVGIAQATAYLYYTWNLTLTASTPTIQFLCWANGTKQNTLSLAYNIYASMTVQDLNSTWGINNVGTPRTAYIWFASVTNSTPISNVTINILSPANASLAVLQTNGITNIGEASAQSWTCAADATGETIAIYITGASDVSNTVVNLGLKTIP